MRPARGSRTQIFANAKKSRPMPPWIGWHGAAQQMLVMSTVRGASLQRATANIEDCHGSAFMISNNV